MHTRGATGRVAVSEDKVVRSCTKSTRLASECFFARGFMDCRCQSNKASQPTTPPRRRAAPSRQYEFRKKCDLTVSKRRRANDLPPPPLTELIRRYRVDADAKLYFVAQVTARLCSTDKEAAPVTGAMPCIRQKAPLQAWGTKRVYHRARAIT